MDLDDMARLSRAESFMAGILAATVTAIGMILLRLAAGVPTLPELLSEPIISIMPVSIFSSLLDLLGGLAKPLLLLSLMGEQLLAGGLLGVFYGYSWQNPIVEGRESELAPWRKGWLGAVVFSIALWVIIIGGLMPLVGGGFWGLALKDPWIVLPSTLAISLSYGLSLRAGRILFGAANETRLGRAPSDEPVSGPINSGRRAFLAKIGLALLSLTAGASLLGLLTHLGRVGTITRGVRQKLRELPLEVTPTQDFYVISRNFLDPVINEGKWRLEIGGLVEKAFSLSYEELKALYAINEYVTLECISNPVGGNLMSTALWKGVPLRQLLEQAGIKSGVVDVVFHAWDDYTDSIPLEKAMDPATLVVYEMNGEPLPFKHGYPARIIVPGIYGMKNVKWVTKIELVDQDYLGFWETRGWSDTAVIKTTSRIDVPPDGGTVPAEAAYIGGVAFAGDRGIARVEISTDGGQTWHDGELKKELSAYTWALWTYPWEPKEARTYSLKVRATDQTGVAQISSISPSEPEGATGHHNIKIWVVKP